MSYFLESLFFHPDTAQSKPLVGCSACLLGEPVRYDGGHKEQADYAQLLLPWVQLQAICPEVGIGLGVPRPTLKVVGSDFGMRVVQVEDSTVDVTEQLLDYADSYLRRIGRFWPLTAYIFKARSPSCGVGSTPVDPGTDKETVDSGLFAGRFKLWAPWLPVFEEEDLMGREAMEELLLRSYLCRDVLWQSADTEPTQLAGHYEALLDADLYTPEDRESLWIAVQKKLGEMGVQKRRELIDSHRAAGTTD